MATHSSSEVFERLPITGDGCAPNPAEYPETPESSRSYWQKEHHDTVADGCSEADLPSDVDVIVIGSGITGAAVTYKLAKQTPGLKVAVLEARGFCSGATGRNGGHISRPEANRDLLLQAVEELGAAEAINLRLDGAFDVFKNQEQLDNYAADHEAAIKNGFTPEATIISAEDTRKALGIPDEFPVSGAAYLKKSGTLWPRKLVQCLFKASLKAMPGLSLHTYTPVTGVERRESQDPFKPTYEVTTARGKIRARAVFHATNAYVSHLVPDLRGEDGVFGAKCHVMAIQPNQPAADGPDSTHLAYSFGYDAFWHWIAQVPSRGPFVYGYSWTCTLNDFDDTVTYPQTIDGRAKMNTFLESAFPAAFQSIDPVRDVTHDWTGIMGFTAKGTSVVGKVSKDSPGEFLSVGHNGEGMSRCFACADFASEALLAYLRSDKSWTPPVWFPTSYRLNI
ncbi:cytochrome P450 monooxygenase [Fusarium globosum]|uniref:Cytochrome P450 monooxygenase n=1 Tax=Fusarium globosum TaxID=78864 RepID=A0A8H5XWB4_9HYPO|nr:cytochrome P450 monooxygenase [Fusarium globosum]